MLKVKLNWLYRLEVHRLPMCMCPFSDSSNKNDKANLKGDDKDTDKESNCASDKIRQNVKETRGLEELKYQQNAFSKVRRKSLSPGDRLAVLLPEEYKANIDSKSQGQNHNLKDIDKDHTQSKESSRRHAKVGQSNDYMKQRFKARTRIQPSKRLSSMLPQDYWQSLDDSETKQIVEDLGEIVNTDSKKPSE